MRSPQLLAALCLLLTASCRLCAATRHGCLFERQLCPGDQPCGDDGLFGQCQSPHRKPVQYQVSVPVLHKLQEVLKDLMVQGLTWRDDLTQDIISQELSRVPTVGSSSKLHERRFEQLPDRGPRRVQEEPDDGDVIRQYMDLVVLDPSRSSIHMQTPLLDPYTYRQQQRFGYRDEDERSLNSLDDNPAFPLLSSASRSRSRGSPLDRDRQLLQDLVSFYLTSPSSSSSSSSSPVQSLSRHAAAAAGFPSLPPSSSSSFFPELDFPVDFDEDYISQVAQLSKQQQQQDKLGKKAQDKFDALSGLDERSLQRLALLLDHYSVDLKDDDAQLDDSVTHRRVKDKYGNAAAGKKGWMAAPVAPPTTSKTVQPEVQKVSGAAKPKEKMKNEAAPQTEEYGFIVTNQSVVGPAITFRIRPNADNLTAGDVAEKAAADKHLMDSETGLTVLQGGVGERNDGRAAPLLARVQPRVQPGSRWVFATLVAMASIGSVLVTAMTVACLRHHAHRLAAQKLGLGPEGGGSSQQEYQDLCRQHMASRGAFGRLEAAALGASRGGAAGGGGADSRVSSVSSQFSEGAQPSPGSHSSTPSWCEEPAQANMDISTGHMILAYMEDHLRNKDRLMKEWEALCSYQAEPSAVSVAQSDANVKKNRCPDAVPYDHARVKLKVENNPSRSDYVNASTIIEHDPRMPAYIATQGPLSHTIAEFWQTVWENGCTVIVMMTALVEDGEKQCDRYWPDEGSSLYHIYEVNLVSEHIWCNDFLVRSFYLKNVQTQETRTLTQFHFLSWPAQGIPTSTRPLLDFRRKVNKCYRGRSCPIIVHCSDGTGRTGTYILIDMVLNRMAKGVKEIDIAASLEHVRDQRPGMVRTKDQFEFALTAVAEEVNAILKALPQ
ncbi:receptor-type tyrosine-protein phosphatase-like N [Brachionichthys hirsutus]|uniref:receptor-type tyrosine-protein phosphatase-like N n=1 Tax=Brachionichthys hirsutus TaxID=412623 RepID=UPI003604FBC3